MKIEVCYIRCFIENLRRQHEELAHPFSTHRFNKFQRSYNKKMEFKQFRLIPPSM